MYKVDLRKYSALSILGIVLVCGVCFSLQDSICKSRFVMNVSEYLEISAEPYFAWGVWMVPAIWMFNFIYRIHNSPSFVELKADHLVYVSKENRKHIFFKDIEKIVEFQAFYEIRTYQGRSIIFFPLRGKKHLELMEVLKNSWGITIEKSDHGIPGP